MAPEKVVLAGDWHGNTRWAWNVVAAAAEALKDEPEKHIIQLGDFGYWPRDPAGMHFLEELQAAAEDADLWVRFIDGNHEDHPMLPACGGSLPVLGPASRISYVPRGTRWRWHDRMWLALGGAVSIDRTERKEGVSWFPEEAITQEQARAAMAGGLADVMLTHDCPANVELYLPQLPKAWLGQQRPAQEHRQLLQAVTDAVLPSHLFHGHYHMAYSKRVAQAGGENQSSDSHARYGSQSLDGSCRVTGLAADGDQLNWLIVSTQTMEVTLPPAEPHEVAG